MTFISFAVVESRQLPAVIKLRTVSFPCPASFVPCEGQKRERGNEIEAKVLETTTAKATRTVAKKQQYGL